MLLFPFRARSVLAVPVAVGGVLVAASVFTPCTTSAQTRRPEPEREAVRERILLRGDGPLTVWRGDRDRAALGVTLAAGSPADTAGVRLESVDADSPAAKAGLKAGDVITAINGVNLRVAREDAEDLALGGLAQRRLQRTLAKAKPGDEVTLQVRAGSGTRAVTVKTVSAAELASAGGRPEERTIVRRLGEEARAAEPRGMVGLTIGTAGNLRDTLGLFVNSVTTGGPADKAGIVEGERIAAVNGVDVRVPREDVEDMQATSGRVDRFVREVQKVEPGKSVTLKVYGNGRYRDVMVSAVKASDLPGQRFEISVGDGELRVMAPRAPMPPRASMAPRAPGEPRIFRFERDGDTGRLRFDDREVEVNLRDLERRMERWGEEFGRTFERSLRGLELDLRELPRAPLVRVMPRRTATVIL